MNFFQLLDTKEDILKNVGDQTVDGSHRLPYYIKILWKSIKCLVTNILQNIFFCVQQLKEINAGFICWIKQKSHRLTLKEGPGSKKQNVILKCGLMLPSRAIRTFLLPKSLSRKVRSLGRHICNASGQLKQDQVLSKWMGESWNLKNVSLNSRLNYIFQFSNKIWNELPHECSF